MECKNTHPFEQAGRLFAHNGVIGGVDRLDAELGDSLSLVHGDTDSERFFALITREAQRTGDLGQAITSAGRWVAANLPVFAINCVLITDSDLYALRYPDTHELHVLERAPGGPSGNEHLESGQLLHVDRGLNATIETVLPEPPAHPLTLADLDPHAAASQAKQS